VVNDKLNPTLDESMGGEENVENKTHDATSTPVLIRECILYLESDPDIQTEELVKVAVREGFVEVKLPDEDIQAIGDLRQSPDEQYIKISEIDDLLNICIKITKKEADRIKETLQSSSSESPQTGGGQHV
jgi:hypothetical protein